MVELAAHRKNKICLSDYNYVKDIENRLIMSQFSTLDLSVLEEILYSSLNIPVRKLTKNLEIDDKTLRPILEKFSKMGLLKLSGDTIEVDKEMRKYYETQALKFDEDFTPGMDYLQSLLRKLPIHVLPSWYQIPRTSDNIFDSLIEKHLLTPHIYQRYLSELNFTDPTLTSIMNDVFNSPDLQLFAHDLIEKYDLSKEQFEEYMLLLEFHFVCCLGYTKINDQWKEIVTPFHEWREYVLFIRETEVEPIKNVKDVVSKRPSDFSFIQDMELLLKMAKKQPTPLQKTKEGHLLPGKTALATFLSKSEGWEEADETFAAYFTHLLAKLQMLKLADIVDERIYALEAANDWLEMGLENRSLFLYRHPYNRLLSREIPQNFCTDRNIREIEKSVSRVLYSDWVYFDDFLKGVLAPINENSFLMLKRFGKTWRYILPSYSEEEKILIKETVFKWLFELGVVATGTHKDKDCFRVTAFGQSLFGR